MKITLSKIVSWGAGVFLVLFGLIGLVSSPVGGILMLAAGVLALPPTRSRLLERADVELSRWAVVGIVLVGGVAGMGVLGSSVGNNGANTNPGGSGGDIPTESPTPEAELLVHDVGEEFTVGTGAQSVRYSVSETFVQESVGTSAYGEDADGIYLVVILEIENVGDESFDITDRHLRAVDDQDREFEADFAASAYAGSDPRIEAEGITYEQLNPGLQVTRAVIFDVNPGADYRLKIAPVGVFSASDEHFVALGSAGTPE